MKVTTELGQESLFGPSALMLARKDSNAWSFGKSSRFPKLNHQFTDVFYESPSTLKHRGTGFGYGEKWSPGKKGESPLGKYTLPGAFDSAKAAHKTFGRKPTNLPSIESWTPGPGKYDTARSLGVNSPKFSFRGRFSMKKKDRSPSPHSYSPNMALTEKAHYRGVSLGFGERQFLRKFNDVPGPGAYTIRSKFDKK